MTLRHKTTGEEFDLIDKHSTEWAVYDAKGERRLFKKDMLEEITPEPQWVDVTEEVDVREEPGAKGTIANSGNAVFHGLRRLANLVCGGGYRLRKADILIQNGHAVIPGVAFIVERNDHENR